jgi:membrane protease YdiL (CAAX protease family)
MRGDPDVDNEPPRRFAPAARLLAFAGILAVGGFLFGFGWRALGLPRQFHHGAVVPIPMLATALFLVALALVASWIPLRWMEHRPLRTIGIGLRASAARDVFLGLLGGGLTPAIVALGFLAAGAATITRVAPDFVGTTLPMIAGMALISSWEEIALRGYFMQVVAAMGGPWVAASLSGLVFGLIHAGNPGANPMGLAITALNGVLLALLVVRTGSLWLVCGYHAGWNLSAAVGFGMVDSGMQATGAFATTTLRGSAFWTGGSYGFEASIVAFVVEALVLLVLLRVAPRVALDAEAQPYYAPVPKPADPSAEPIPPRTEP